MLTAGGCFAWMSSLALAIEDVAVDLARFAVEVNHPEVKQSALSTDEVSVEREGNSVYTFVRVRWTTTGRWKRSRAEVAEVQATFLIRPKQYVVYELDYVDTVKNPVNHKDHTPRIIAEYNTRLQRLAFPAPGATMLSPVAAPSGPRAWLALKPWSGGAGNDRRITQRSRALETPRQQPMSQKPVNDRPTAQCHRSVERLPVPQATVNPPLPTSAAPSNASVGVPGTTGD